MPTPLKDPALRARRNKIPTAADLPAAQATRGPELPARDADHDWHPAVADWWRELRESPQAALYTPLDWRQALDLAKLRELWERAPSAKLWGLIQRASIGLGLTRDDQRRNGWKMPVVPVVPVAVPALPAPEKRQPPRRVRDPRSVLRSVPTPGRARSA